MKCLPFALTLFAVLAAVSPCRADGELRALQDSVVRWLAAHPDDLLAEAFTTAWSDEADGCVEVHLLRADSAMKARFRRCVHDSRRIRLAGFDPGTVPYPPAPEGGTAPAALFSMHAEYALYPCDADTVRLTIRNAGRQRLCFGTDYAVCRLHGGFDRHIIPVKISVRQICPGTRQTKHDPVAVQRTEARLRHR